MNPRSDLDTREVLASKGAFYKPGLGEGGEASQEWERWARAQLSADWQLLQSHAP